MLQVMNSELGRTLSISPEEAEDKLLNLSPYETKVLINVMYFCYSALDRVSFTLT